MKKFIIALIPLSVLADVAGPTVTVKWDPLTLVQQTDVDGFYVYCSTVAGGPYMRMGQFQGKTLTSAVVPNCKALGSTGSAYFVASSYSVTGQESAFSREAVATWIAENPPTPVMVACVSRPKPFVVYGYSSQTFVYLYDDSIKKIIGQARTIDFSGLQRLCEGDSSTILTQSAFLYATDDETGIRGKAFCIRLDNE